MSSPFSDLDAYNALPRVSGLALSPDGARLVATVAAPVPDGQRFGTALWQLDPSGAVAPRRLTRSAKGESSAGFLPDGSVVFTSTRPDPDAKPDGPAGDEDRATLWLLPGSGGEARLVADPPAGVGAFAVAERSGTVCLAVGVFPGAATLDDDAGQAKARKDGGVTAQLYETRPVRMWDHYLGPRARRLFTAAPPDPSDAGARLGELHQVAAAPGFALDDEDFDLTPDGSTVVAVQNRPGELANDIWAVDVATGERRLLVSGGSDEGGRRGYYDLRCSPDGRRLAFVTGVIGDRDHAQRSVIGVVDVAGGPVSEPAPELDLWPGGLVWAPDGDALFFTADEGGHMPAFRLDLGTGTVTRLSGAGAFADLCASPDGTTVYALRSSFATPPEAVALDSRAADQEPRPIPTPGLPLDVPGHVEELTARAADGTPIRSWLVLPPGASADGPAPLLVAIHGGPNNSWNAWSWRWQPQLFAARGYAVLLPDPALSTGYGQSFLDRGRGRWGDEPFTDLMAAVDAALERPDLDATRTAAAGGSFGGYMANWVAGHTDRFRCIVSHASIWALDQFSGTTDHPLWWENEFGRPSEDGDRYQAHSPHHHAENITTPMLVIHGEADHRCPVSESLRLWHDLSRSGGDHKFLHFPDENHWILKPQHAKVWYETVFAFLDHHVLGKAWERPTLL